MHFKGGIYHRSVFYFLPFIVSFLAILFCKTGVRFLTKSKIRKIFKSSNNSSSGFAGIFVISILSLAAFATIGATVLYAVNRKDVGIRDLKRNHEMLDIIELLAQEMLNSISYDSSGKFITVWGIKNNAVDTNNDIGVDDTSFDGCVDYNGNTFCGQFYRAGLSDVNPIKVTLPSSTTTTTTTTYKNTTDAIVSIGIIKKFSDYCKPDSGKVASPKCLTCKHKNTLCIDIVICKDVSNIAPLVDHFGTSACQNRNANTKNTDGFYYTQTVLLDLEKLGKPTDNDENVIKVRCSDYPSSTEEYLSLFDDIITNPYAQQIEHSATHCLVKVPTPPPVLIGGKYYVVVEDFCYLKTPITGSVCRDFSSPTEEEDCPRCNKVNGGSCAPKTCSDFGSGLHSEDGGDGDTTYSGQSIQIKQDCFDYVGSKCMRENGSSLECYLHTPSDPACQPPPCNNSSECAGLAGICPGCTNNCTVSGGPPSGTCTAP